MATYRLVEVASLHFPGLVDSNSPSFWADGSLYVFNSRDGFQTFRSDGSSAETLTDTVEVRLPKPDRPGKVWLEAVWFDSGASILYGWYHFEPTNLVCQTAPVIGAAISTDHGQTWENRGFVVENGYDLDCRYDNGYVVGGSGDFSVILDTAGQFFYFIFSNYAGPAAEQGIGIARSAFLDKGQPGTVFKFYNGLWSEPGLAGRSTAVFPSATGWKGPFVDAYWGPSVHWNPYLNRYLALLNHTAGEDWQQEGVYITFSTDLVEWTSPVKLLEANAWYPQVIGLGPEGSDTRAGSLARLYVGGVSDFTIAFER